MLPFFILDINMDTVLFNEIESKDWLRGVLRDGPVTVTFTKKNGEERILKCTLKQDIVPLYEKKTDREKAKNDNVLSVWDLDLSEWRSFRFDSIKKIEFSIP